MNEYDEDDFEDFELEKHVRRAIKDVRTMLVADSDPRNFVCTDTDGARHDLSPSGYYITSKPEGLLHRIHANYPPDEIAEIGFDEVHRLRGLDPIPIDFLVDDVEHARMLRDGVLDAVEGKNVLEALCERADALLRRQREN
jgi:hypothetical protein